MKLPSGFATSGVLLLALSARPAAGQVGAIADVPPTPDCPACSEWNAPHEAVRIFGNSYWVGTNGLGAILVTSAEGHVLIDGGLPESAPPIIASIRALGFRVEDIRLILNSHIHFDHAGGIAALQRASGARVAASASSAAVLESGSSGPDDPQHGILPPIATVDDVQVVADGETLRVGPLELTAHFTPGHTPGGTSWSWRSCEEGRCLDLVYADSQTPVSADDFYFTRTLTYPNVLQDFERGHATLERIPCDILLTPHPGVSRLWERIAAGAAATSDGLVDSEGCRRYAANARRALARRLAIEAAAAR
jgi:metallo-beta-lactamase class B